MEQKVNKRDASWELVNFCEFDKYAIKSYCAVHEVDESLNLGDITQVNEKRLKPFNMICGGSPCFPAGTKITTPNGVKFIEDIVVGDYVLTHSGSYKKVLKAGQTGEKQIYTLRAGWNEVSCTQNHKFYTVRKGVNEWIEFCNLKLGDKVWIYNDDEYGFCLCRITSMFVPYKGVEPEIVPVFDLEVEDDHSFIANNFVVHNCTDFSLAGKQAGAKWECKECGHEYNPLTVHYSERNKCPNCGSENLDKTRSSLLVEWLRIIQANKPTWGIYENVKNLVGKKFKDTFQMFLDELHEYGYNTYYKVLNAKDYGIPQNRERVYLIIILKEYDNGKFKFPEPFDNGLRMRDFLEDEVDEKFYVNTPKAKELIDELVADGKLEKEFSNSIRGGGRGSLDRHQWDMIEC